MTKSTHIPLSKIRSSVYYTPAQAAQLERVAASLGLYHLRGIGKSLKVGSISRLMQAIGDGTLVVKRDDDN